MDENTQALLVAEVLAIRAEQEAFFSTVLATVLGFGGANVDSVPTSVMEIMKIAKDMANRDVQRKLKRLADNA